MSLYLNLKISNCIFMKKFLILLFAGVSLLGYAQKFQLTDSKGNPYTNGQVIAATISEYDLNAIGEFAVAIKVENLTDVDLNVRTVRTNLALVEGTSAYVCFGNCQSAEILTIDYLLGGNQSLEYSLHIVPDTCLCHFGLNQFQLDFSAGDDNMTLYVNINMQSLGISTQTHTPISLSAYPNPVSTNSQINVSYTLEDSFRNYRLVIRNTMGSVISNILLNPYEKNISVDISTLQSGVYFYSLENKSRILIAKKLIIK